MLASDLPIANVISIEICYLYLVASLRGASFPGAMNFPRNDLYYLDLTLQCKVLATSRSWAHL